MGTAVSWLPDSHTDVVQVLWPQSWNSDTDTTEQRGYDVIESYYTCIYTYYSGDIVSTIYIILLSGCQAPKSNYMVHPTIHQLLSLLNVRI